MQILKSYTKHIILLTLFITSLGGIIFFPLNLNNEYTCLYHRFFSKEAHISLKLSNHEVTDSEIDNLNNAEKQNSGMDREGAHDVLLQYYIRHYAGFWWASITLFTLSIILLKKMYINKLKKKM